MNDLGVPAEQRANASDQLARGERLREVIVGTELEANDLVDLGVARRQHQDRHVTLAPDPPADLEPVNVRQHHVEDDDLGPILAERLKSALAILGGEHFKAFLSKRVAEGMTQIRVVVDDQQSRHGRATGNVKRNVAPRPGPSLLASMPPPCAWMMCFAIARPSPVPPPERERSAL